MSKHIVVVAFTSKQDSEEAFATISNTTDVEITDFAHVNRLENGKLQLTLSDWSKQTEPEFWGNFVGMLFWTSHASGLLGRALAALQTLVLSAGLSSSFIETVATDVVPGRSMLCLCIDKKQRQAVIEELQDFPGELYYTSLEEAQLKQVKSLLQVPNREG